MYGLATPEAPRGVELSNVAKVLPGQGDPANDAENGARRQTDISVITAKSFEVRLRTRPVRLLDSDALRDVWADGDQALLKLDAGRDVNGNGKVDFAEPGSTAYGFERFRRRAARSSAPAASAPREATESSASRWTPPSWRRACTSSRCVHGAIAPTAGRPCSATSSA